MVALEQSLMLKKLLNLTEALPGALQQMGKSSFEGQLCPVPMSSKQGPSEPILCFELMELLCCSLTQQDRPASVCHTKHIFGRSDFYGIAGLAYEGLDRRTLALQALYILLAFHQKNGGLESP